MKKIITIAMLYFSLNALSQPTFSVKVSETDLNSLIGVIVDARVINFGDYLNQYGLNAWWVNLNNAGIDIQPNNKIVIQNIQIGAAADVNLVLFSKTVYTSNVITGSIEGEFEVQCNPDGGYSLYFTMTDINIGSSNNASNIQSIVATLIAHKLDFFEPVEVNLGSSLLPGSDRFINTLPSVSTTATDIVLTYNMVYDNPVFNNVTVKTNSNAEFYGTNSLTFAGEMSVPGGSTFSASIISKGSPCFD